MSCKPWKLPAVFQQRAPIRTPSVGQWARLGSPLMLEAVTPVSSEDPHSHPSACFPSAAGRLPATAPLPTSHFWPMHLLLVILSRPVSVIISLFIYLSLSCVWSKGTGGCGGRQGRNEQPHLDSTLYKVCQRFSFNRFLSPRRYLSVSALRDEGISLK